MGHVSAGQGGYTSVVSDARAVHLETQASPASANSGGLAEQHLEEMFDMATIPPPAPLCTTPDGGGAA